MATSKKKAAKNTAPEWHHFDASEIVLGRLATQAAHLLMGKHRPDFAPNTVAPVHVVVTNADKLKVTGQKLKQKTYYHYTGYAGNLKHRTLEEQMQRDSRKVIEAAVVGMLPKNNLRKECMKHLKVYTGTEHPHSELATNA